jgi:hypothetical protein
MKEKNIKYLRQHRDVVDELGKEYEMDVGEIEEIIDQFFQIMKGFVIDPKMPSLKIGNLGTFKPTIGRLNWHIEATKRHMSSEDDPKALSKIDHLSKVVRRLEREKNGDITWKEWRDKDMG